MTQTLAALLYLIAGALFILALRGLSSPATSRQGDRFGVASILASVNIFRGFMVTERMLATYKKR